MGGPMRQTFSWQNVQTVIAHWAGSILPAPVYGVPRGGCVPAGMLATMWGTKVLDEPQPGCLVVDDIIDSGRTRERFKDYEFVALVSHRKTDPGYFKLDGWIDFPWEANETGPEDSVVRLIEVAGGDPNAEGLKETPARVIKALRELTKGNEDDPVKILEATFHPEGYDEIIALSNIPFYSLCEHHLLPFFGSASVAYLPNSRIVGLSKLARIVNCFSRRIQVQERLTVQIADAIEKNLGAPAVAVIIKAQHLCMTARGVSKPGAEMTTSVMRGHFREKPEARAEVLRILGAA
jgi:GTP cyclohydrolase IA